MMSGVDAVHVRGERIARATDAALHFVEDENRAVLAAAKPQRLEERLRQIDRAGDPLHRLDDHGGGAIVDQSREVAHVASA